MCEKVIRDGKVAVLVSAGYGAGWSTWAPDQWRERSMFDPLVVAWVEGGKQGKVPVSHYAGGANAAESNDAGAANENTSFYTGGAADLKIVWVPVGTEFRIGEYDGYESVVYKEDMVFYVA